MSWVLPLEQKVVDKSEETKLDNWVGDGITIDLINILGQ
jgi:hypothetical protein